ncbi:hypothetical protein [uncultured Streptococcus sp.]|uniref:hypothetical protein n=1 Tax=uncultured Streptococcus sp. TaxID=83427 RepID=UPI00259050E9|nr:hypothetical protein [uncultured Streptococcus sp.]
MAELKNLNELKTQTETKFHSSFSYDDRRLPAKFKELITKFDNDKITYNEYSFEVQRSSEGIIVAPNQWLYIAAYYSSYCREMFAYKQELVNHLLTQYNTKKALEEADLVLLVLNSSEPLTDQDRALLELSKDSNRIILLNKTDLPEKIEADQLPDDVIRISVLKNENIDLIEERINQLFFDNAGIVEKDATYLSNARHISLIEKAVQSLQSVNEGLEMGMPVDLLQIDLTRCWEILGEITGDAAPDELINQLFTQFCLGK